MDLIREELLRQTQALEQLLLGARPRSAETSESPQTHEAMPRSESRTQGETVSAEADMPAFSAVMRQMREFEEAVGSGAAAGTLSDAEGLLPAADAPAAAWDGTRRSGGEDLGTMAGAERRVTTYTPAAPVPGTGARELSRLFQRDARRYDGGFTS